MQWCQQRRSGQPARGPLVVVAGLPGAGKSAALRCLLAQDSQIELVALDSAQMERRLRARLPRLPYRVYRPLVHVAHWVRIVRTAVTGRVPMVVHETATRRLSRWLLLGVARLGRRRVRMVWLEVPAQVAVAGQTSRGRVLGRRAFARHLDRVRREHPVQAVAGSWDMVAKVDRGGVVAATLAACSMVHPGEWSPAAGEAPPCGSSKHCPAADRQGGATGQLRS